MPRPGRAREILEAFTRQVAEVGYDETNFSAVAAEVGLSKGALSHHFGAKEQMLAALQESYMDRRSMELDLMTDQLGDPAERLAAVLHAFVIYYVQDRAATVAVHREIARLADREAMATGRAMRKTYLDAVREVLADGIGRGLFQAVDPALQTLLVFGSAQWMWTWFDPDGPTPPADVGSALVTLVLGGLLVDRAALKGLADPEGPAAKAARAAVDRVADTYDVADRIAGKR
ncbi:TetR/AcrR family transcriptional regulator [Pseudonocardia endophytica]|uniref:TetR family transcriptional regulator n=1 Tax=Pseudonocardia endophytica TaxID=401976 RepID=A0A4R1HXV3_PSEEN|nr:TetR/AcrR family transcriptional regulator [Pseudonocardia endophytica]TCK27634.1 TetR family transcriptional regulator [Pseudonocardia endophytica]